MSLSEVCSVHIAVSPPSTLPQEVRVTSSIGTEFLLLSRGEGNFEHRQSSYFLVGVRVTSSIGTEFLLLSRGEGNFEHRQSSYFLVGVRVTSSIGRVLIS